MKDLIKSDKEKNDALTRIQKFMSDEDSGVVLTAKEEQVMARWFYANALLKERKYREERIIDYIKEKFGVSKYTARADISNARSLFSSLVKDLKKYVLHHHIENLQILLRKWEDDKSMAPFYPRLADSLTRAVAALPDEASRLDVPAPVVNINVAGGITINNTMSADEALKAADDLIEFERNHEYTDFEETDDKP